MGFANKMIQDARKIARGYVLPHKEICNLMLKEIDFSRISCVGDFGAGTLFFSDFFASTLENLAAKNVMGGGAQ